MRRNGRPMRPAMVFLPAFNEFGTESDRAPPLVENVLGATEIVLSLSLSRSLWQQKTVINVCKLPISDVDGRLCWCHRAKPGKTR